MHRLPRYSRATALLVAAALSGCGVGPRYHRPTTPIPAAYAAPTAPDLPSISLPWWEGFGAPELDQFIAQARMASPDMLAAAARIVQADQAARVAGSPLLPGVTATASQNYQRSGVSNQFAGFTLPNTPGASHYSDSRTYSGEFSATYELDFWGKNRDALVAARASALASRFDAQTVWLTTASSIATTYFAALGYRDRLEIATHNLAASTQILHAYQGQLDAGTASALDVSQQEALVAGYRAQIPALQSDYEQEVLALGILVGEPPEQIRLGPTKLTGLKIPTVNPGLPSDLLRRRPDVANAEAQLIAQNATVRQDVADFFPSLQLTASGGVSSAALSALTGPGSLVASLATSLSQTIFDNGLKSGTLGEAKGRYAELAADYAKSVLQALTDVETALTEVRYATEQERLEADAVRVARHSADIVRAQMQAGTVDIVTQLNTETTLYNDQDTLSQVRASRLQAIVSLYKALGGGWSAPAPGAKDSLAP